MGATAMSQIETFALGYIPASVRGTLAVRTGEFHSAGNNQLNDNLGGV